MLGDLTAAAATPMTDVTFWGAQWVEPQRTQRRQRAKCVQGVRIGLHAAPPACGGTWTTSPGNSSRRRASVPAFMGVVVASKMTKCGSTISGDIVQIVVVAPDPGYDSNPGHPGTGKLVAVLCP